MASASALALGADSASRPTYFELVVSHQLQTEAQHARAARIPPCPRVFAIAALPASTAAHHLDLARVF